MDNPQYCLRDTLVIETDFADNTVLLGIKGRAVITNRYKYIVYDKGDFREQLFDLEKDPGETKNLVVEAGYRKTLKGMRDYLKEYTRKNNDPFDPY